MPTYQVTDPQTGKTLKLTGDSPPTEQELEQIFSEYQQPTEPTAPNGGFNQPEKVSAATNVRDGVRSALQGATFGWADEIGNTITAGLVTGLRKAGLAYDPGESYSELYDSLQAKDKQKREDFQGRHPVASTGLEIAGGLASGVGGLAKTGVSKGAHGASKRASVGKTAAVGAVEGGLYGAGAADSGEKIEGGTTGALAGAVLGPIAGKVLNTGGKVVGRLGGGLVGYASKNADDQANQVIRKMAEAEGLTPDQAVSKIEGLGDKGTIADVSDGMRTLSRAASDLNPSSAAKRHLERRQLTQNRRLKRAVVRATGKDKGYLRDTLETIAIEKQKQSAPLYEEAFSQAIPDTAELKNIIKRLDNAGALRKAAREAKIAGESAEPESMRMLHYAKQELDDQIGAAKKAGERSKMRNRMKLKSELLEQMDQVEAYDRARNVFAGASQLEDAAKEGADFLKTNPDDLRALTKDMSDSERHMFQMGAVRAFEDKIDTIGESHDATNRLFNRADMRERFKIAFGEKYEEITKQVSKEAEFSATRNRLGGSQTSTNEAAKDLLKNSVVTDLRESGITGAAVRVVSKVMDMDTVSPDVLESMTNTLFKRGLSPDKVRAILESPRFARALGDDWDRVVKPYIDNLNVVAGAPIVANEF